MVKILLFKINLSEPEGIYVTGQVIKGTLRIRVNERLRINSIKVNFVGSSRVYWKEVKGSGQRRCINHHRAIVSHVNYNHTFNIPNSGSAELYLDAGELALPFEIPIPGAMPTSFEHEYGRIRYVLHAIIHIPWSFDRYTSKLITVINQLNLNATPTLRMPQGIVETKHLCCACCRSRPIEVDFNILKSGYVPGEIIFFRVGIDNQTSREIIETYVNLMQVIKFSVQNGTKLVKRVVCTVRYLGKVKPRCIENWNSSCLQIPPLCSTLNGLSALIQVNYSLVLYFHLSGISFAKSLTLPIVIGTVPILNDKDIEVELGGGRDGGFGYMERMRRRDTLTFEHDRVGSVYKGQKLENRNESSSFVDPEYEAISGELIESDEIEFKPAYPYYKN